MFESFDRVDYGEFAVKRLPSLDRYLSLLHLDIPLRSFSSHSTVPFRDMLESVFIIDEYCGTTSTCIGVKLSVVSIKSSVFLYNKSRPYVSSLCFSIPSIVFLASGTSEYQESISMNHNMANFSKGLSCHLSILEPKGTVNPLRIVSFSLPYDTGA